MGAVLAFLTSPLGQILVKEVPALVGEIIKVAHEKGHITAAEIVDYIASGQTWDQIAPAAPVAST